MIGAIAFIVLALAAAPPQETPPSGADNDGTHHLIFLAENRPVFVRLRVVSEGRPFEASWIDSIRTLHANLDRNHDGKVTTKEATPNFVTALVQIGTGAGEVPPLTELDVLPKDGVISIDELAEACPTVGPFRMQMGRQVSGRTDAPFEQLDRDKDSQLTKSELAAIAGSLRPLDLNDDEMIGAEEIEPLNSPVYATMNEELAQRPARFTALLAVIELVAGESSFRNAWLLLKKYDRSKDDVPGRTDNKLSHTEFAIDAGVFAGADTNGDDALDTDELRKLLAPAPADVTLEVNLSPDGSGRATARVEAQGPLPEGAQLRRFAAGDVEFAIGKVRLDIHVEDGNTVAEQARRILEQRFKAADLNKNGYLEGKERAAINAPAGLSEIIDSDGDGKIYLKELLKFGDRHVEAAHARLVLTSHDQGRAIFGIVDLDRDRRLGARELLRTVDRVMSWDGDGDGQVSAGEVPYHFQITIARGGLPGLTGDAEVTPARRTTAPTGAAIAPDWFQKMDRNHDGDVSAREFFGPRDQFERLDSDNDGLIDSNEASAAPRK